MKHTSLFRKPRHLGFKSHKKLICFRSKFQIDFKTVSGILSSWFLQVICNSLGRIIGQTLEFNNYISKYICLFLNKGSL